MTTPAGGDVQLDAIADSVAAAASGSLHAVAVRFERMNPGSVAAS